MPDRLPTSKGEGTDSHGEGEEPITAARGPPASLGGPRPDSDHRRSLAEGGQDQTRRRAALGFRTKNPGFFAHQTQMMPGFTCGACRLRGYGEVAV